jgi:hypothetical protein
VHPAICWKTRVSVQYSPYGEPRPRRVSMGSDNLGGAENQQERLIKLGWVIGFVDGEGCFSISFVRQPHRRSRKGYKTGYQVTHRFVVTQGAKSLACLEELRQFFGVGRLYMNRRHDNHREHLWNYMVERRPDLLETVIPFFERYPMRSAKQRDFKQFSRCVRLIAAGRHLSPGGLIEIAEIAQTMNRQKPRRDLIRILRGHTPDTLDTG